MNKKTKKTKAFSLLEIMIALFLTFFIILAAVGFFAKIISYRKSSKMIQGDIEVARNAIEEIAKNMRMSEELKIVGSGNKRIRMYSVNLGQCLEYAFSSSGRALTRRLGPPRPFNPGCDGETYSPAETIFDSGSEMSGNFIVTQTVKPPSAARIGKATVYITFSGNVSIQTTVSFRDYKDIIQ